MKIEEIFNGHRSIQNHEELRALAYSVATTPEDLSEGLRGAAKAVIGVTAVGEIAGDDARAFRKRLGLF